MIWGQKISLHTLLLSSRRWLGWKSIAVIIGILCIMIMVLEKMPARFFVNTIFTATIVAQEVRFRVSEDGASIHAMSAGRILARELQEDENHDDTSFHFANDTAEALSRPQRDLELTANDPAATLELNRLWLPAYAGVKVTSRGENTTMRIEFDPAVGKAQKVASRFDWRGDVTLSDGTRSPLNMGSRVWEAARPHLTLDEAQINGLMPAPIPISGIEFDRIVSGDQYQSHVSAIVSGNIQFDTDGFPGKNTHIREGEMLSLRGLDAQIINFSLAEKGLLLSLIGSADTAQLGFLDQQRGIYPSMLDAIRARESWMIILSVLFTLMIAFISGINAGNKKNE